MLRSFFRQSSKVFGFQPTPVLSANEVTRVIEKVVEIEHEGDWDKLEVEWALYASDMAFRRIDQKNIDLKQENSLSLSKKLNTLSLSKRLN